MPHRNTHPLTESHLARYYKLVTSAMTLLTQIETALHLSFLRVAKMADALGSAIEDIQVNAEGGVPPPPLAQSRTVTKQVLALVTQLDVALSGAITRAERLSSSLETAFEAGVEHPLQTAVKAVPTPSDPSAEHRRAHRRGMLSRITCDPEVESFILGIINHMTYAQVVEAVARAFPPERHISRSLLHRWWRKRSPAEEPQSAVPSSY